MSKRTRDSLQQQGIAAKKLRQQATTNGGSVVTLGEEEEHSSCRVVQSIVDRDSSPTATSSNDGLPNTVITDIDSSIQWRRLLWISAMGVEDLVLGWFPFSEQDFVGQTCWDDDYEGQHPLDDIWQIKHIQEIPKANSTGTAIV